jgi:hypothetical protein
VNNALDAIRDVARVLIVEELQRCNPALLAELRTTDKPTNEQSDAIVNALSYALSANYGQGTCRTSMGWRLNAPSMLT